MSLFNLLLYSPHFGIAVSKRDRDITICVCFWSYLHVLDISNRSSIVLQRVFQECFIFKYVRVWRNHTSRKW